MKEVFKLSEKKNKIEVKTRFSIRLLFMLVIFIELLFVTLLSNGIAALIPTAVVKLPSFIWVLILAVSIGGIVTYVITYYLLNPITELSHAMMRVAEGDFDIHFDKKGAVRETKQLYASFNRMTKELKSTELLQNDFVSNVSHEFKTPLATIEGYATLLQDKTLSDEQRDEYVEKIRVSTARLSELVRNVLLLSKVENGTISNHDEQFRLDEEIRQSIFSLEKEWTEKNIDFDIELESVVWVGNRGLLFHVWTNLIANAIKFNTQNGFVGIYLTEEADRVVFTVTDSGVGIKSEDIEHIFERFYQGDSSRREEGNGLGLALVSRICAKIGAEIEVNNRTCGGAEFRVIFTK